MENELPCGRSIHPSAVDVVPVCLMHSLDPAKDTTLFDQEFNRIIAASAASGGIADFTRFVFRAAIYWNKQFPSPCVFDEAKFLGQTSFQKAKFEQGVRFKKTTFGSAEHSEPVYFTKTHFRGKTEFHTVTFWDDAHFSTTFEGDTAFTMSIFEKEAGFYGATFEGEAYLGSVQFKGPAVFPRTTFRKKANFGNATFSQHAFFAKATFEYPVSFIATTFTQPAHFADTSFLKGATFYQAKFLDAAEFRETRFLSDSERFPSLVFAQTELTRPEAILFFMTDLSRALFLNRDISQINFSSVDWGKRANGKRRLFEERVSLDFEDFKALRPKQDDPNPRNYQLIAETYQQLKKNYDDRKDYWTAGDFHYGEMEMKRLHSPRRNKVIRWLHSHLGLIAWYRYASEYGESYVRPLLVLLIVILLFTFLFPIPGLVFTRPDSASPSPPPFSPLNYGDLATYIRASHSPKWIAALGFFGHSLMTTLSVAGFQKELIYQPAYPWGRALALLELLLTSTLIALFLLALRRQFRR